MGPCDMGFVRVVRARPARLERLLGVACATALPEGLGAVHGQTEVWLGCTARLPI